MGIAHGADKARAGLRTLRLALMPVGVTIDAFQALALMPAGAAMHAFQTVCPDVCWRDNACVSDGVP